MAFCLPIVLQAGAARRVWETDPTSAPTSLAALAPVAREGLTELLRSLDSLDSRRRPIDEPKLAQLLDLLGIARVAGV